VIRRVQAGETVTVSVRNRPVARIVPIGTGGGVKALMRTPGISWQGGKPAGLPRGERLPRGVNLADWVAEERR
jgi:antitoxin (DNA-binding transcriptional repressor) of toxin-antitoxin stability system